jgi:tribbles-like protein
VEFESPPCIGKAGLGGTLSPDLQPSTPPTFPPPASQAQRVCSIGKYLLLKEIEAAGVVHVHKAIHFDTQEEYTCKVIPINKYRDTLAAYWRANCHDHVSEVEEILLGETQAYVFFPQSHGDLHSYVRNKRKLREPEASRLFQQIVSAVSHCHENGIVLRDLKLRKFVFKDFEKTQLKLEGLEDACLLDDSEDDALADKHGCPAYVSPEILNTTESYSGKAADIWSLGVMLYTMLVGRYPFHDTEPAALFKKIRRGQYKIPDSVSSKAKCLIRSLLRMEAQERLTAEEILEHPWFSSLPHPQRHSKGAEKDLDQTVPDIVMDDEESFFT